MIESAVSHCWSIMAFAQEIAARNMLMTANMCEHSTRRA